MNPPNRIIIVDGVLKMRDGSSLKAYLRKFQKRNGIKDGTAVNILERKRFSQLLPKKPAKYIPIPLHTIQPTDVADELALAS